MCSYHIPPSWFPLFMKFLERWRDREKKRQRVTEMEEQGEGGRKEEIERERENLLFTALLLKCFQWPFESGASFIIWDSHSGDRDPSISTILSFFPRHIIRELHQEWSMWDLSGHMGLSHCNWCLSCCYTTSLLTTKTKTKNATLFCEIHKICSLYVKS